ncbi:hypothetical protein LUI11_15960 [Bradyrhizobium diazoefficiens]|jgi:hypothetical protein|uniref:Uncharacterized protein n=1 Tax=Bradyrhizobium diazoefficiens SEMIA 5080 TaxID=754504 RepID=A0A837C9K8_9BRAD|nr:hypothetical protein [Bradyrhizobium diazoefficiens]APO49864.1 hypothetical protein BD122_06485 [Bradyrhizobium diazoefficiens]KGJ65708.1 hypothetical protein BJA5080_02353 [Bradyrhizobium diazoefficiens SEMIA 5080]KOY07366.1 hypothetical protein AF336_25595 [Bradyrhizobium diazoefficiens]MCD9295791.1 hypothetical protein [Bradyrhizobium diazoefficiens]MCD9810300.1 hypothetical protein [Bradyrhizobium diazoefficiens]
MRWPKRIELDLPHEAVAMFELGDYEKLLYCFVAVGDGGWVALDRHYEKVAGGGYLSDGGEAVVVSFAADPRQVGGCFSSVVGNFGFLYETPFDSAAEYKRRIDRLLALSEGCFGSC